MNDITIVIQGRVSAECYEFYCKEYRNYKVIISTWEDVDIDESLLTPNIKLIKSVKPQNPGKQNIHLQVQSTHNGLELVDTEYSIKMRGDEMYSNIEYIYETIKNEDSKIWTSSIYFRHWMDSEYHISDHLIAGRTQYLQKMFSDFQYTAQFAEISICWNYFKNIGVHWKDSNATELMIKYFDILDLTRLEPYLITSNSLLVKKHTKFIPEQHKSISKMEMLYNDKETQKRIFNQR